MEKTPMRLLTTGLALALVVLASTSTRAEVETKETKKQKTDRAKKALNKVFKGRLE